MIGLGFHGFGWFGLKVDGFVGAPVGVVFGVRNVVFWVRMDCWALRAWDLYNVF